LNQLQLSSRQLRFKKTEMGTEVQEKDVNDEVPIDPKVMEPFQPIAGQVPRKVAIDRK